MHGRARDLFTKFFSNELEADSPFLFWLTQLARARSANYSWRGVPNDQEKCYLCSIDPISVYLTVFTFDFFEILSFKNFEEIDNTLTNEHHETCLRVAIENGSFKILEMLLAKMRMLITTTVEIAAGLPSGEEIVTRSLKEGMVTENMLLAAAQNRNGANIMSQLLARTDIEITENIMEAAASNPYDGKEFLIQLFERSDVMITKKVLMAAASKGGGKVIALLLEKNKARNTENILIAAACNLSGGTMLSRLLENEDVKITEDVMVAAAASYCIKEEIMAKLLERFDKKVTEKILGAAAGNRWGEKIMAKLLEDMDVNNTEKVLMAAARTSRRTMVLLLERKSVKKIEQVLMATMEGRSGEEKVMLRSQKSCW